MKGKTMAKIDVTNLTEVAYTDGTTNVIAVTMASSTGWPQRNT
jgi:hypothetical protein